VAVVQAAYALCCCCHHAGHVTAAVTAAVITAAVAAAAAAAGTRNLAWSKYLLPSESERRLPTLSGTNHEGASLKGTVSDRLSSLAQGRWGCML
jgi:hypothetical protein